MTFLHKNNKARHWEIQNKWQVSLHPQNLAAMNSHFPLILILILNSHSSLPTGVIIVLSLSLRLANCGQIYSYIHQTPLEGLPGAKDWAGCWHSDLLLALKEPKSSGETIVYRSTESRVAGLCKGHPWGVRMAQRRGSVVRKSGS